MEATFNCPISSMQVDKGEMPSTQDVTNNLSDIIKSDRPLPLTMQSALQTVAPISNIPPFDLLELMRKASRSMRSRRASDESGLVAEMFKHGNRALHERRLETYNNMLQDECLEVSWQDSFFKMLPKTGDKGLNKPHHDRCKPRSHGGSEKGALGVGHFSGAPWLCTP